MAETLIVGLILALVSGITFIAYKHPKGYEKIHNHILLLTGLAFVGLQAWDWGVTITAIRLDDLIMDSKGLEALGIRRDLEIPYMWIWLACGGVYVYSFILLFLPQILGLDKKGD